MTGKARVESPGATSGVVPSVQPDDAVSSQPIRNDAFVAGEVIAGKYIVERVIGVGGVGIVLAARHAELDETVAIKFLHPEVQSKTEIVRRFAREAKAAVRIKSEYAARVYDVGVLPGRGPYLVMEYLDGKDLADCVAEAGPMPVKRAVEYVMEACEALAVAHSSGIIHRDIKPENLFLSRRQDGSEIVKVLDFGISKAALTGSVFGGDIELEKTQDLMGSPLYMSPEQIRSTGDVDHRTDIWSLGVVLYELITARAPFHGETITKICASVLEGNAPPLSTYMNEVPDGLQAVVDRCLQKDQTKRFQNVAELAIALLPFGPSMARVFAERTSTILRASGQNVGVTLRFHSSAPPPGSGPNAVVSIPGAPGTPAFSTIPGMSTNPEALNQIAEEARRTRRIVIIASLVAVVLALGAVVFVVRGQRASSTASAHVASGMRQVTVDSDPPGARVEWDGKLLGETPVTTQLPEGSQTLQVSKDGYAPETLTVNVTPDDSEKHPHVTLKHDASATPMVARTSRPAPVAAPNPPPPPPRYLPPTHGGRQPPPQPAAALPLPPAATTATPAPAPSPPPAPATAAAPKPSAPASTQPNKVKVVDDGNRVHLLDDGNPSKVPLVQ